MSNDFINNFVKDVCFVLGIKVPEVTHDFSCVCINTRREQYTGDGIFIPQKDESDWEFLFCIVHDLRIRWQFLKNADYYDFKSVEEIGIDNFDNQAAEVDANAFATLYMIGYVRLMDKFSSASSQTRELVLKRIEEMLSERL